MADIPRFRLSHGQVAWALCHGQRPDPQTIDTLRYLRQLGVPFTAEERGVGRGHRLSYHFDHLIECALAVYAVRRGIKPKLAADYLTSERRTLRALYRETFRKLPQQSLKSPSVKSRGASVEIAGQETYLRLHEAFAERGGKTEAMTLEEMVSYGGALGDLVERFPNRVYPLIPLQRVMLDAVAWAQEAPATPAGRPPRRQRLIVQTTK